MLGTELRYAFRSFRRQRTATALVVAMLTLGIAANIVVFSLINSLFLRPFQFAEPDRLVYFNEKAPIWNLERVGISYPDFVQWRKDARVFESLALYSDNNFNLADDQGAERILGGEVTYDFLAVVGLRPILGRFFTAEEDRPNAARVTVISERMWRDRFGARQDVIGRTLRLNGVPHEIVGVLPRAAEFPLEAMAWVPLAEDPNPQGTSYGYEGIGRLKPGVSIQEAETDLLRAHQPIWDTRDKEKNVTPIVRPLRDELVRDFRTIAAALFAAVTLLLAIACANVAAVMLARAIARRKEMGIRLAVGANRMRLIRQLFVENVLLATAGGILGVLAGRWAFHLLVTSLDDGLPYWVSPALDVRLVAFSVLLTVVTTVLFGWAPALHAVRGDLRSAMNDSVGGTTASPGGRRTLTWLVAAEFTIASILLAGGGLLFRAFDQVRHVDPGFAADHVLTFSTLAARRHLQGRRGAHRVLGSTARTAARDARGAGGLGDQLPAALVPPGQLLPCRRATAAQARRDEPGGAHAVRERGVLRVDGHPPEGRTFLHAAGRPSQHAAGRDRQRDIRADGMAERDTRGRETHRLQRRRRIPGWM